MQKKFGVGFRYFCLKRQSAIKNRKLVALAIFAFMLSLAPGSAVAQQSAKIPRIGYLTAGRLSAIPERTEAFREGLRELGYVDGKNILIEWRSAEGKINRAATLAAELVHLKVDVIVTGGETATRAAKKATSTIPIVMIQDRDPVGNGFVASLARPGGNITGLSRLYPELSGKRLGLLKEIVPKLSRVAVFTTLTSASYTQTRSEDEFAAERLGVRLQYLDVQGPKDFEAAFREAAKGRADAVLMQVDGPIVNFQSRKIAELAIKSRLPVMHSRRYVEAGGLISYGESITDLDRRAATYVDKILKGAKPADLPVEQPTKFELVINLKAAKALGLKIPPELLMEADKVIE